MTRRLISKGCYILGSVLFIVGTLLSGCAQKDYAAEAANAKATCDKAGLKTVLIGYYGWSGGPIYGCDIPTQKEAPK